MGAAAAPAGWPAVVRAADFDAFVLDMDGVLWHGAEAVPGALETVARLQGQGKRVFFVRSARGACAFARVLRCPRFCSRPQVTNNSSRSRATVAARLAQSGVTASADTVLTSGAAAAEYLAAALPAGRRRAFVVGERGLLEELALAGVECDCGPPGEVTLSDAAFAALFDADAPRYEALVLGADSAVTAAKLARASAAAQRGALFVCTNPDAGDKCGAGIAPGAGALLAAVETASGVRAAAIVGKPAPTLLRQLLARHGLDAGRTVMIGDRLDTDVAFGNAGGVASCLVLTGVATAAQAAQLPQGDPRRPTHLMPSLAHVEW